MKNATWRRVTAIIPRTILPMILSLDTAGVNLADS
jgi:hypothetical protein